MPKHQAKNTQPARPGPLSRNELIAPGFLATLDADDNVIAVHTYGLAGNVDPADNTALHDYVGIAPAA